MIKEASQIAIDLRKEAVRLQVMPDGRRRDEFDPVSGNRIGSIDWPRVNSLVTEAGYWDRVALGRL